MIWAHSWLITRIKSSEISLAIGSLYWAPQFLLLGPDIDTLAHSISAKCHPCCYKLLDFPHTIITPELLCSLFFPNLYFCFFFGASATTFDAHAVCSNIDPQRRRRGGARAGTVRRGRKKWPERRRNVHGELWTNSPFSLFLSLQCLAFANVLRTPESQCEVHLIDRCLCIVFILFLFYLVLYANIRPLSGDFRQRQVRQLQAEAQFGRARALLVQIWRIMGRRRTTGENQSGETRTGWKREEKEQDGLVYFLSLSWYSRKSQLLRTSINHLISHSLISIFFTERAGVRWGGRVAGPDRFCRSGKARRAGRANTATYGKCQQQEQHQPRREQRRRRRRWRGRRRWRWCGCQRPGWITCGKFCAHTAPKHFYLPTWYSRCDH